jgi:acylphosphatase
VKRVHVLVDGMVQGVFFRAACARHARALGLGGSVRNLPDGRVEAAFEGPDADVDAMVAWCHEGTDWARVDDVTVTPEEPRGDTGFHVRNTPS